MLAARGLGFGYTPDRMVATDIDLRVADGEVVALVGPNGAGKSTLLALLEGRLRPTSGTVEAPERRTDDGRLDYGYVAEHNAHYDDLTGRENALFFARAAGLSSSDARRAVDDSLAELGLDRDADRPVSQYSFGARRKLALAEALTHAPGTALLDEPTVGLDAGSTAALRGLLRRRADEGLVTVFAAHDLGFVADVADRVIFLVGGRIAGGGVPEELVSALGDVTRFDVQAAGPLPEFDGPVTAGIEGLRVVRSDGHLVLESDRGPDDLPRAVDVLISRGVRIRAVTVREAGLAEAFEMATGQELGQPEEPDR